MLRETDNFYFNQDEPNKSCLLALRSIILAQDDHVTETTKYGMPCFCFMKKMFCYLWIDKKTLRPYILMVEGKHLAHPNLVQGNRKRMKVFRVNPNNDLPIKDIQIILQQALALYRNRIVALP